MPNIATVLKQEITRLARKESKYQIDALRKATASLRAEVTSLKRQLKDQESALKQLQREVAGGAAKRTTPKETSERETNTTSRFSAKGLASTRRRLGLSASDLGKLIGASGQSVYAWESGATYPRMRQIAAIAGIRSVGKKEARRRLDQFVSESG